MKYILGIFGFIILAVVAIILLSNLGGNPNRQEGDKLVTLTDYTDDGATVSFTTQGRIVGEDQFRAIQISVTPDQRQIEILGGYNGNVIKQETFSNTEEGYKVFMQALSSAGFSRERDTEQKDYTGVCPLGRRYLYELREGSERILNLWSTTCSTSQGTFGGDDSEVQQLFQNQIPTYNQFITGVRL